MPTAHPIAPPPRLPCKARALGGGPDSALRLIRRRRDASSLARPAYDSLRALAPEQTPARGLRGRLLGHLRGELSHSGLEPLHLRLVLVAAGLELLHELLVLGLQLRNLRLAAGGGGPAYAAPLVAAPILRSNKSSSLGFTVAARATSGVIVP